MWHSFELNEVVKLFGNAAGTRSICVTVFLCVQGDYAAARMYYQRALLLSPGSKLLKENLAKLDRLERRMADGE